MRLWTVRLLGDEHKLGERIAPKLAEMTRTEPSLYARSQFAASAKRLSARGRLARGARVADARRRCGRRSHAALALVVAGGALRQGSRGGDRAVPRIGLWRAKLVEETILPRLIKRFAMAGTQKDYQACVELFRLAPEKKHGQILLKGFEEAFKGRSIAGLPDELIAEIARLGGGSVAFGVRQGKGDAIDKALAMIAAPKTPLADRLELIDVLGEAKQPRSVPCCSPFWRRRSRMRCAERPCTLQAYRDEDRRGGGEAVAGDVGGGARGGGIAAGRPARVEPATLGGGG